MVLGHVFVPSEPAQFHAIVVTGQELSGAAQAGLDLVSDPKHLVLRAQLADAWDSGFGWCFG